MEAFEINNIDFEALKRVDVQTVDPDTLVDINSIIIPENLTQEEKMREYIRQAKNPFCIKVGDVSVGIGYSNDGVTLEQCIQCFFSML